MIILCSTDAKLQERWQECLAGRYELVVCTDEKQFSEIINEHKDAILLLHMSAPHVENLNSAVVISSFIKTNPTVKVIACADLPSDEEGLELLKVGVFGYANSWMASDQLERVVEQVSAGEVWVGRNLILRLINDLSVASQAQSPQVDTTWQEVLTTREREVAMLIGSGNSNKHIAAEMKITERTVKAHLSAIFRKTDYKDRIQLALRVNQTHH